MSDLLDELDEFFVDEVSIEPYLGQDGIGDETYGAPAIYRCRIRGKHKTVKLDNGQESVSTVQVILAEVAGVSSKDRVTLPARFTPNRPQLLDVDLVTDEDGPHHERLMF